MKSIVFLIVSILIFISSISMANAISNENFEITSEVSYRTNRTDGIYSTAKNYSTTTTDIEKYDNEFKKLSAKARVKLVAELDDIKTKIQKKGALWKADYNPVFLKSDEEKIKLLGLKIKNPPVQENIQPLTSSSPYSVSTATSLPSSFDWRNVHGNNYITDVRDQGGCGSCWAFGALAVAEGAARTYYNNPNLEIDLSEQDLVSCFQGDGCQGLYDSEFPSLFEYIMDGISNQSCFPYTATNEQCSDRCNDWQSGAWKFSYYDSIPLTIDDIKNAIITKGPVEVGMAVYYDFFSYSGGIYQHTVDSIAGYHAVAIVGFGTYDGLDYWIVKNSWGSDWGENGYFRIFAGECGIDSWFAYALNEPIPPTPQQVICTDNDGDGYCFWGLGSKPINCPTCSDSAEDIDDSNPDVYEGHDIVETPTGKLNITSTPSESKVYVADIDTGNYFYRGRTPNLIKLNNGERQVKISKEDYLDNITTVNIQVDQTTNLQVELFLAPKLSKPLSGSTLRLGSNIEIYGTASHPNFQSFIIEYQNYGGGGWLTNGITLNNGGLETVENDILATWDASSLTEGLYNIRLTVNYADGSKGYAQQNNIYLDPNIKEGWPKNVIFSAGSYSMVVQPTVADINNDGKKELIFAYGKTITVLDSSGNYVSGWPKDVGTKCEKDFDPGEYRDAWMQRGPAVADLDKDGFKEIVVGDNCGYLTALNHDGTYMNGWPKKIAKYDGYDGGYLDTPTIADVDNDGYLDIIVGDWESKLHVLNYTGQYLNGWPKVVTGYDMWSTAIISSVAVADLDKDGFNEIVFTHSIINWVTYSWTGYLNVLNHDGTYVSGWPKVASVSSPTIFDINKDNEPEIVVISGTSINAFSLDGTLDTSWPIDTLGVYSQLAVGDINNDKNLELIFTGGKNIEGYTLGCLFVYTFNGRLLNGWPQCPGIHTTDPITMNFKSTPMIGNLDNDEESEISVSSMDGSYYAGNPSPFKYFAFNPDGTIVDGWPKRVDSFSYDGTPIADIDGDGKNEVIDNTGNIYVWDTPGNTGNDPWPAFHGNEMHTNFLDFHYPFTVQSPKNNRQYGKNYITLNFTVEFLPSEISYRLDGKGKVIINRPINLTKISDGAHSIVVYADSVSGKNYYVGPINFFYCLGDINGDKKVNILDATILSNSFGKKCGDKGFDDRADFNGDCKVNILDSIILSSNQGKICRTEEAGGMSKALFTLPYILGISETIISFIFIILILCLFLVILFVFKKYDIIQ